MYRFIVSVLVALGALLSLAQPLCAQQPAEPSHEFPMPGTDGSRCVTNEWNGDLGAGTTVIGEGNDLESIDPDLDVPPPAPAFQYIPSAGDGEGTVNSVGDKIIHIDLIDPPSLNGYQFDFRMVYRTNRVEAATEIGQPLLSHQAVDLASDWNFGFMSKVLLPTSGGVPQAIAYMRSGSGGLKQLVRQGNPPPQADMFYRPAFGSAPTLRSHIPSGDSGRLLDEHKADGSVMRYELVPGETDWWRPSVFYDPYDNAYEYAYDANGRIQSVTDPRGVETRFVWGAGTITIKRYVNTAYQAGLDEVLGISNGKITSVTLPQTSYVDIGAHGIYDLANPMSDNRQYTLTYNATGQLENITDSRTSLVVLHTEYQNVFGRYRVASQTDQHGEVHGFSYTSVAQLLFRMDYTDPLGNVYSFDVNDDGYPVKYKITPGAGQRPRFDAGETPEPTSLTWEFGYSGCGCGQVTYIKYPSGREYFLQYDAGHGLLTTWQTLSPTGTGQDSYGWDYEPLERGLRPKSYLPPMSPLDHASLTWSYNWTPRSFEIWGEKPTQITVTTSPIDLVNSGQQVLFTYVSMDSMGRPTTLREVGGMLFDFFYVPSGTGAGLLERVERRAVSGLGTHKLVLVQDDLGRVTSIKRGTDGNFAETTFTNDVYGRTVSASVNPGAAQPTMTTVYDRDMFENVAVVRRSNIDYTGQGPKYDDGSGTPRSYIRSDYVFYYNRLHHAYIDRRALPEAESLTDPVGGADPWMLHYEATYDAGGRIKAVKLPNGATTGYVSDGYGTLYKALGDTGTGGLNQDFGRRFFDSDLMLHKFVRDVKVGGATDLATTTFGRNHGGKGFIDRVTLPDGVQIVSTYDRVAQETAVEVLEPGSTRRQYRQRVFDQLGRVRATWRHFLDASGNPSGAPVELQYLYNDRSQVTEVWAPLGRKAFRTYDPYGRLKTVHDNLSTSAAGWNEVELQYMSGRDLVTKSISKVFEESDDASPPAGTRKEYETEYQYDLLGRVVATTRKGLVGGSATPLVATFSYNSLGQLAYLQEPQQQGATDQFSRTVFDALGRWVEFIKRGGGTNKIVLASAYVDAQATSKGTAVSRFDGRGFETRSEFDALYRLQNHYRPGHTTGQAHQTIVQYDVGSMVDRIVDGNGSEILYARDIMGRVLTRSINPGGGVSYLATKEVLTYDTIGRLSHVETRAGSGGSTLMVAVDFDRDSLNRVLEESFQYTATSGVHDVTGSYSFTGASEPYGDPSFRRSVTYPSGMKVDLEPDALARLETVKLTPPGGSQFTLSQYRYAGSSMLHRDTTLGSGGPMMSTNVGFDDFGRLSDLSHQIGTGSPFEQFSYTWNDADDLIRKKRVHGGTTAGQLYQYDPFHRLTGVKLGVPAPDADGTYQGAAFAKEITYGLDPGQNRSSVTVQLSGQNPQTTNYTTATNSSRYSQVGTIAPLYDGEGNLVFDGAFYYVYDFRNRIAEVYTVADSDEMLQSGSSPMTAPLAVSTAQKIRKQDLESGRQQLLSRAGGDLARYARENGTGTRAVRVSQIPATGTAPSSSTSSSSSSGEEFSIVLVAYYGYDPFNRRVVRNANGEDLRYAYDGWRELEEMKVVAGSVTDRRAFVWGHGLNEMLSYQLKAGSTWTGYYPVQDEQGSVIRLLDGAAQTVERIEYDPYGRASFYWNGAGSPMAVSQVGNPWTYATARRDAETGLLYLRHRYQNVEFGRFCTVDPAGGWFDPSNHGNAYAYTGNAATIMMDPLGLESCAFPLGLGGGAGGGVGDGIVSDPGTGGPDPDLTYNGGQDPKGKECKSKPKDESSIPQSSEQEGSSGPGASGETPEETFREARNEARARGIAAYSQLMTSRSCVMCHQASLDSQLRADLGAAGLSFPSPGGMAGDHASEDYGWIIPVAAVAVAAVVLVVAIGGSALAGGAVGTCGARAAGSCAARGGAQLGNKLDYFLGGATGSAHNVQRSSQMLRQLESIGLHDTAATRQYLADHLSRVLADGANIIRTEGSRTVRESLLMGPGGGLKFETVWEQTKLITGILFGGR